MLKDLEAGLGRLDITPVLGIEISGYYVPRRAESVLDPLEVNALAVRSGEDRLLLISVDNCGMAQTAVYDHCRARISAATGVSAESIFISSTHTHTGPYWEDSEDPAIKGYTDWLEAKLADAAKLALDDLRQARMG